MPSINIIPDLERTGFVALEGMDPTDPRLIHLGEGARIEIGCLEGGMVSGAPSVMLCFELPDDRVVLAETSLSLLLAVTDALRSRYGDPRGRFGYEREPKGRPPRGPRA